MTHKSILVFFTILLLASLIPVPVYSQGTSFSTAERITSSKYNVYISSSQRYHYYIYTAQSNNVTLCLVPKASNLDVDLYVYYTSNLSRFGSSALPAGGTDCVYIFNRQGIDFYIEVYLYTGSPAQSGYYDLIIQTTTQQQQTQQVSVAGCNCRRACNDCGITGSNWLEQLASTFNPGRWGACICCHIMCPIAELFSNMQKMLAGMVEAIAGFFKGIADAIINFFNNVKDFFVGIANGIVGFFTGIANAIAGFFAAVGNFFASIGQGIINFFGAVGSFLASIPAGIMQLFSSFASTISSAFGGVGEGMGQALGGAGAWLGRNWPYLIGLIMIGLGFFFGPWLIMLGLIVVLGYSMTTGDLDWRMIILSVGVAIVVFALKD